MKTNYFLIIILVMACSCGGAPDNVNDATNENGNNEEPAGTADSDQPQEGAVPVAITTVTREQLDELLKKGPANILAMVQTDSHKQDGKFIGFRIVSFRVDAPEILGLRPEDIITRVNGLAIETPDQYFEVFERLKKADKVSFKIIRNGEVQELETPILP